MIRKSFARIVLSPFAALAIFVALPTAESSAAMSDDALLKEADRAVRSQQWLEVVKNLYAYVSRSPAPLKDRTFAREVDRALQNAEFNVEEAMVAWAGGGGKGDDASATGGEARPPDFKSVRVPAPPRTRPKPVTQATGTMSNQRAAVMVNQGEEHEIVQSIYSRHKSTSDCAAIRKIAADLKRYQRSKILLPQKLARTVRNLGQVQCPTVGDLAKDRQLRVERSKAQCF